MTSWMKASAAAFAIGFGAMLSPPAEAQNAPDTQISGTISVWTWPNNDRTFAALLPTFNKAYPNIKVEVQGFPAAKMAYLNNLQRGMLGGSGPDVAMMEINMMALLRDRPQWEDLRQAPYNAGEFISNFAPFTVANVTLPDGKIVALPKHTGPGGLFYRRDIFKEAGLPTDPEEVTKLLSDWNAFIDVGKKVAKPNERWMLANGEEIVRAMMAQKGVSNFDAEGNLQFDNPVFHDALEIVKKAADAGLISPFVAWSPEWQGAFGKGQIATVMYGNWFGGLLKRAYATADAGKWGVALAPASEGGSRSFNSGGDYIGILKTSKNKEAAWAFVKWLVTDGESLKQQYQSDDLYPAFTPAGSSDWINYRDPYYDGQNVNEIFAPVQAQLIPSTLNQLDSAATLALQTAIDNVVKGVATVDEALAQAKAEVKAKM
ncbi:sugar ABC transporter substrate-binding protein [Mesorhizobium sp. BAC0120]|uniref:ABC transporter substrate-binding protein n=1 Tax=Mesorhizobium sp. BAC0120 TaxID=3090670 RepID=UPI00298C4680|nr:sugar ABC transporter substrate-binding protein [Mesorhizobium sp. BAC0120]MDW6026296.1 sugar ABC transporter substrate-binding protein [Mesorhizobium sp. BAC0120]